MKAPRRGLDWPALTPAHRTHVTIPFIDLQAPYRELRNELDAAAGRVLASGRYVLGPELEAFEREFARYCEADFCVGVGSGLDALRLILEGYGIGPGDEVLVPAHTFIATWLAVSQAGATPVPVEPDERTYNLRPDALEATVTGRTRAIIAVHLYGQPADLDALRGVAERHDLALIEDAAQAHGARYRGRRVGGLSSAAGFSFYPSKNLGAMGDGGAVVTDDSGLADRVRVLRSYGSSVKYRHEARGLNSRLDELQAAVLRVKLAHLDDWNARRRDAAARYLDGLAGVEGLRLPAVAGGVEPVWHLFVVRSGERDSLQRRLRDSGVETLVHYPVPVHRTGAYREYARPPGDLQVTERLAEEVLSLPMGPHMSPAHCERVLAALHEAALSAA